MQTRICTIFNAACVLALMVPMIGCAEIAGRRDRPSASYPMPWIKKDCYICHLAAGSRKAGELKKKLSTLCLDCHRDRKAAEHTVDIVPAMEVK